MKDPAPPLSRGASQVPDARGRPSLVAHGGGSADMGARCRRVLSSWLVRVATSVPPGPSPLGAWVEQPAQLERTA